MKSRPWRLRREALGMLLAIILLALVFLLTAPPADGVGSIAAGVGRAVTALVTGTAPW